jgi:hypothetical protein
VVLAEALADDLLHARVIQFALAGRLARDQLVDRVADDPVAGGRRIDGKDVGDLSRLELADGVVTSASLRNCDSGIKPMSPPLEAVLGFSE